MTLKDLETLRVGDKLAWTSGGPHYYDGLVVEISPVKVYWTPNREKSEKGSTMTAPHHQVLSTEFHIANVILVKKSKRTVIIHANS